MDNMSDVEAITVSIEEAREKVRLGAAMDRLQKNSDFKDIVDIGYLRDEAVRVVMAKSDHTLQDPVNQQYIDQQITAIGHFRDYLHNVVLFGRQAAHMLEADQAELELAEEEEADLNLATSKELT